MRPRGGRSSWLSSSLWAIPRARRPLMLAALVNKLRPPSPTAERPPSLTMDPSQAKPWTSTSNPQISTAARSWSSSTAWMPMGTGWPKRFTGRPTTGAMYSSSSSIGTATATSTAGGISAQARSSPRFWTRILTAGRMSGSSTGPDKPAAVRSIAMTTVCETRSSTTRETCW